MHCDLEGVLHAELCCLLQVCVGAEAEDNFHMVEIEGLTYDGKSTKVPLAVLKPSIMPSVSAHHEEFHVFKVPNDLLIVNFFPPFPAQMSLGGFEIMPPVTFRLQAGSGPVHISGQHFIREYSLFTNTGEHIQKMFTG